MKRPAALVVALAMILALAACGGSADQPSSDNTPPVTQEGTNQPDSTPTDSAPTESIQPSGPAQPSEPVDTTPDDSQSDPGAIPAGAIPLYDGIHYIQLPGDFGYYEGFGYTAITGEKIAKETIEIAHENTDYYGSIVMTFGNTAPLSEQIISASRDGVNVDISELPNMTGNLASGDLGYLHYGGVEIGVANRTENSQPIIDCHAASAMFQMTYPSDGVSAKIDGQTIGSFDDLVALLGAPTAAYGQGYTDGTGGDAEITYIWLFNDFIIEAPELRYFGEGGSEAEESYVITCCMISEIENIPGVAGDPARRIEVLTALGLL